MEERKIRACLFDMDGTLLNTEDIYTEASTELLARYGKGPLTWDVKIDLQGRPGPEANKIVIEKYNLPIGPEQFLKEALEIQESKWSKSKFLPGALELLKYLYENDIPIALGTSSNTLNYQRKSKHLEHGFKLFGNHVVTGDDVRIPKGRGKPHPDIWHVCLESINKERRDNNLPVISMEETLVFEDGIPGVKSGIVANGYVIWIPHAEALQVLDGEEHNIIGENGEILKSLEDLSLDKFGL